MAKMKNILVDVVEFESEIKDLLSLVKEKTVIVFELIFNKSVSTQAKKKYLYQFVNDEEIVEVTVSAIETGLITKDSIKS